MSFEKEFAKESGNAIKAVEEVTKVVAIELFSGVITSSPVGNPSLWKNPNSAPPSYTGGALRSNFFLSFTSPSTRTTDSTKEGDDRLDEVRGIATGKVSERYILTNNLIYAPRIESGWSSQAPVGVIAPNVSRVNALIPKIEKAANAKYGVK